jgi:hypothetical protein
MKKQKNFLRDKIPAHIGGWFLLILFITAGIYACQNDEPETKIGTNDVSGQSVAVMKPGNTTARTGAVFTKDVGGPIPEDVAQKWIANYREKYPDGTQWQYIGADLFQRQLNQPGAVGLKLQYAINDDGVVQVLPIAVDEKGNELVGPGAAGYEDMTYVCPPKCPN